MATPTFAIWGALLGWILMPRIRRSRSARAFRPVVAYLSAIVIAVAVMYYFNYHRQSWLFVLGLVVQLAIFLSVAWFRYFATRSERK